MTEVTRILELLQKGESAASARLLQLVYDELRLLADRKLVREAAGQTLQPTALVHEAYLRLVDVPRAQQWDSRGHFFAAAAEAMRRILVERARRKQAVKRGGGWRRHNLDALAAEDHPALAAPLPDDQLLALDQALAKLEEAQPRCAELVKLRFFAGLTIEQASSLLDVAPRTAKRDWTYARAWLRREIEQLDRDGDDP